MFTGTAVEERKRLEEAVKERKRLEEAEKEHKERKALPEILLRSNSDIKKAVKEWCANPQKAQEIYGHVADWDTSTVTDMAELFRDGKNFNENISKWNVSKVTNMG